jgi:hypothetical protein
MRQLFSGEPGRPVDETGDRLERLIELLRGLDAGDLELFNEILPRLVEWKGGKSLGIRQCELPFPKSLSQRGSQV